MRVYMDKNVTGMKPFKCLTTTFTVSDNNVERLGKTFRNNLLVDTGHGATSHIITDTSKFVAFDKNFNAPEWPRNRAC